MNSNDTVRASPFTDARWRSRREALDRSTSWWARFSPGWGGSTTTKIVTPKPSPFYLRSLAVIEKALGPEHSHAATNLHGLAELYRRQGKYTEADQLYQRAHAIEILSRVVDQLSESSGVPRFFV